MKICLKIKKNRKTIKSVSYFLIISFLWMSIPYSYASAAMIGTESLIEKDRSHSARDYVKRVIAKKEVRDTLISQGIDPLEAKSRVDSLSDAEVIRMAEHVENMPAGGSAFGVIVSAALIVFIVLLITDILGYTNVFPFVS